MKRSIPAPTAVVVALALAAPAVVLPVTAAQAVGYDAVPGVTSGPPTVAPATLPSAGTDSETPSVVPVAQPSASTAAPVARSDAGSLPFTGADLALLVGAGVVLMGAGGALHLATRRSGRPH